jgi:hypothetical protein
VTTDVGIAHTADMWLELHDENAIPEAQRLAAEMKARGDNEGADTWLLIIVAIEGMRRNGKPAVALISRPARIAFCLLSLT